MDLTPLIDMVFLLLVFFLVTSTFKKEELALLLKLPKTEEGSGLEKNIKELTLELSDQELAVNGAKKSLEELPDILVKTQKDSLIQLRVDGEVRYTRLVKVLDLLQTHKLENVSLITIKNK
jgi:biopolymer transport protein ExbD